MPVQKTYDHATGVCRQAEVSECGKPFWNCAAGGVA